MTNRRLCPMCLKQKPLGQFRPRAKGKRGGYCDTCRLKYFREYNKKRYASPEARQAELERGHKKYAEVVRPRRDERKKKLIRMMGGKCSICGYCKSAAALDFDHLEDGETSNAKAYHPNPDKHRTISHLLAMNTPNAFDLAVEEAKKCRLICSNCHRELTYPGHEL